MLNKMSCTYQQNWGKSAESLGKGRAETFQARQTHTGQCLDVLSEYNHVTIYCGACLYILCFYCVHRLKY